MPDRKIIDNNSIKALANMIQKMGGVLFLGPGVATYKDTDTPLIKKFTEQIPVDFGLGILDNDPDKDYLSYVLQKAMVKWKGNLESAKTNYNTFFDQNLETYDIFKNLAKLNFKLIINTNPDKEVYKYMAGEKLFDYCNCKKGADNNAEVKEKLKSFTCGENTKLQYNLLGSFDQPGSIRLCEQDYIELIENVYMPEKGIPACIRNYINSGVPLVFLGFDFDQWHYKILFRIFNIGLEKKITNIISQEEEADFEYIKKPLSIHTKSYPIPGPRISSFFEGEFRLNFEQYDLGDYVHSLVHFTDPNKQKNDEIARDPLVTTLLYRENSKKDEELKDRIISQFQLLVAGKYFDHLWNISFEVAGTDRMEKLRKRLLRTRVLIILLSSDFHTKDQVKNGQIDPETDYDEYIEEIIKEVKPEDIQIFPIILRDYAFQDIGWLKEKRIRENLLPLNDAGKVIPLDSDKDKMDAAIKSMYEFIKKKIQVKFP